MESSKPEENPAEPVPDVVGAAEPAQPAEPEETPAEFEAETNDNANQDIGGTSSTADNVNGVENLSIGEIDEKLQLRKNASTSSKRDKEEKHTDGKGSVIQSPSKEFRNRQSQTFFKYMKNLTNYRCVQILNQEVDHGNSDQIFYVSSKDLLYNVNILED